MNVAVSLHPYMLPWRFLGKLPFLLFYVFNVLYIPTLSVCLISEVILLDVIVLQIC